MKELTIEEKAQRYDEAIERVNDIISRCKTNSDRRTMIYRVDDIESIFPELQESKDERIRKDIIYFLSRNTFQFGEDIDKYKSWIAWLEKQGEHANFLSKIQVGDKVTRNEDGELVNLSQLNRVAKPAEEYNITGIKSKNAQGKLGEMIKNLKPVNEVLEHEPAYNVEPKFHEGEWIVYNRNDSSREILYVCDIRDGRYYFNDNIHVSWSVKECDEKCHLWTIQYAKDGDVLINGSNIFIFHFINDTRLMGYCHTNTDDGKFYDDLGKNECFCLIDAIVTPATKKQRGTLMKVMADAGYTFDFDKKELKKVEHIIIRDFNSVFSKEQGEEIDKRIEESQRLYNAKLRDAMRKVEDFPMTD